jgi:Capsule polysaccharide biosynthesis protein
VADKIVGRALVCTRPIIGRTFHEVAARVFEGSVHFFSDFVPSLEANDLRRSFYRHYRQQNVSSGLGDIDQILARDRLLRLLPRGQALRMIHAMRLALEGLLDHTEPDYVLTMAVDCYTLDLLHRLCRERGITSIGMISAPVEGLTLITSYGEFRQVRDPEDREIDTVLAAFLDDDRRVLYGQRFPRYSAMQHARACAQHWSKVLGFQILRHVTGDPLNFRYLSRIRSRTGWRDPFSYPDGLTFDQTWESKAESGHPTLFVPLAHWPEASTDYWLRDLRCVNYETFILEVCTVLAPYYRLLVKEHWSLIGQRPTAFYRALRAIEGVILVPAEVNSRVVMRSTERMLVGAGMAGFEGALRGKRVATLDTPYYDVDGVFLKLGSADAIRALPATLEAFKPPPTTLALQRRMMRRLLAATITGYVGHGPRDEEENWNNVAAGLIAYINGPSADVAK